MRVSNKSWLPLYAADVALVCRILRAGGGRNGNHSFQLASPSVMRVIHQAIA
jgi:hypothetical protein